MSENTRYLALVQIDEAGPEWLEWAADMYESYAADREACEDPCHKGKHRYAIAAQKAAEETEYAVYAALEADDVWSAKWDV